MASVNKRKWTHNGQAKEAWVVRYTDGGGKRRMKTFDKKKDADRYRTQVESEMVAGTHTASSASMRISDIVGQYLDAAEGRHRDGRNMGRGRLELLKLWGRKHIVPFLGRKLLTDLTFADVEQWANERTVTGKLAPGTVTDILHAFRGMVDFAIKRGYASRNVVREIIKDRRGTPRTRIRTFTKEQAFAVIRAADVRPPGRWKRTAALMRAFIHVAAFCGLRKGEIAGLTVEALDFEKRFIRVRHSLTDWDELKGPKTKAGIRDVPMPLHVAQILREWLDTYFVPNPRNLIFRSEKGARPLNHGNFICHSWWPLLRRAGLDKCPKEGWHHFHALRHFASSHMIDSHLPLTDVAALLGHEKFDMTLQVYAHPIVPGHKRLEIMDRMAQDMMAPQVIEQSSS